MNNFKHIEIEYLPDIGWIVNPDDYTVKELIDAITDKHTYNFVCDSELEAVEE